MWHINLNCYHAIIIKKPHGKPMRSICIVIDIETFTHVATQDDISKLKLNSYLLEIINIMSDDPIIKKNPIHWHVLSDIDTLKRGFIARKIIVNGPCILRVPLKQFEDDLAVEKLATPVKFEGAATDLEGDIVISKEYIQALQLQYQNTFVIAKHHSSMSKQAQAYGCKVFHCFNPGEPDPQQSLKVLDQLQSTTDFKQVALATDIDDTLTNRPSGYFAKELIHNPYLVEFYAQFANFPHAHYVAISARSHERNFFKEFYATYLALFDLFNKKQSQVFKNIQTRITKLETQLDLLSTKELTDISPDELKEIKERCIKLKSISQIKQLEMKLKTGEALGIIEERYRNSIAHFKKEHIAATIVRKFCSKASIKNTMAIIFLNSAETGITKYAAIHHFLDEHPFIKLLVYFEDNPEEFTPIQENQEAFEKRGVLVCPVYIYGDGEYDHDTISELIIFLQRSASCVPKDSLFHHEPSPTHSEAQEHKSALQSSSV